MTLNNIINELKIIALSKPNIRYFGEGDVFDLNHRPNVEYGVFWVTQGQHNIYEHSDNYTLTLFYIDRLTDNFDNKLKIQSDGIRQLENIVNTLQNTEDVEVKYPLSFQTFQQRFADDCAGTYCTVIIETDGDGTCDYE